MTFRYAAIHGLWTLMLVLGSIAGCTKPQAPTLTPVALRVSSLSSAGVKLDVEVNAYNPNWFPIYVRSVQGTLKLANGAELGRGYAEPHGTIGAESSRRIASRLTVNWTNLGALAPFAFTAGPVPYTFQGTAAVFGEKLNLVVPFEIAGELSRAQLLQMGVNGLSPPPASGR